MYKRQTDADYVDFKKMLHKRKFTYDRQSEKMLKNLKEIAEFEGYMDGAKEEFAALETKLTHNLDQMCIRDRSGTGNYNE